jgi:hypothetical protein
MEEVTGKDGTDIFSPSQTLGVAGDKKDESSLASSERPSVCTCLDNMTIMRPRRPQNRPRHHMVAEGRSERG